MRNAEDLETKNCNVKNGLSTKATSFHQHIGSDITWKQHLFCIYVASVFALPVFGVQSAVGWNQRSQTWKKHYLSLDVTIKVVVTWGLHQYGNSTQDVVFCQPDVIIGYLIFTSDWFWFVTFMSYECYKLVTCKNKLGNYRSRVTFWLWIILEYIWTLLKLLMVHFKYVIIARISILNYMVMNTK